jgi:hypothetical protein
MSLTPNLLPCVLNMSLVILADDLSDCLNDESGSLEPQCQSFTTLSFVPLKSDDKIRVEYNIQSSKIFDFICLQYGKVGCEANRLTSFTFRFKIC